MCCFFPIRLNRGLGLCKSGLFGHWSAATGFRREEWTRAAVWDRVRLNIITEGRAWNHQKKENRNTLHKGTVSVFALEPRKHPKDNQ